MQHFRLGLGIAFTVAAAGVAVACSSSDNPPQIQGGCTGAHCSDASITGDGGGNHDAGDAGVTCMTFLQDAEPSTAKIAFTGQVAISTSPGFPWLPTIPQDPPLTAPATVHVLHQYDYTGTYNPIDGGGQFLVNAPSGTAIVYVSDVDGGNGTLDTMQIVNVNTGGGYRMPAVLASALDAVFAAQSPPITRDPAKATLIFSVVHSALNGGGPAAGVSFTVPGATTVLYDKSGGFGPGTATAGLGLAIIPNFDARECPGEQYKFAYSYNGASFSNQTFVALQGKVAHVPLQLSN